MHKRLQGQAAIRMRHWILKRDGFRCVRCNRPGKLEIDHKTPLAAGGGNEPENLQAMCRSCHQKKTIRELASVERKPWYDRLEMYDA